MAMLNDSSVSVIKCNGCAKLQFFAGRLDTMDMQERADWKLGIDEYEETAKVFCSDKCATDYGMKKIEP